MLSSNQSKVKIKIMKIFRLVIKMLKKINLIKNSFKKCWKKFVLQYQNKHLLK